MNSAVIDQKDALDESRQQAVHHAEPDTGDLKKKTIRAAGITAAGQGAGLFLRLGSMFVIARLVTPEEFGIVGMVTAFTGFLALFRDVGLSMATVQRPQITHAQTSTLFWINIAVGGALTLLCAMMAPFLTAFYKEQRLFWITIASAAGFLFYGVSAQHRALLQRKMLFGRIVLIDVTALVLSVATGITMAWAGLGYWALVAMALILPAVSAAGAWLAERWVPGLPQRGSGIRSMLHFGGIVTFNSFMVYLLYNLEKVLLGRVWGPVELGIYGRGYQLINLPTENLNSVLGTVVFPALARVQSDPLRLRSFFLQGYGIFLAVVMPITLACALLANDIVLVMLGPKWSNVVPVFQLLSPTILAFALINPLAWLMQASGLAVRSLKISFLIAPVVIVGYVLGLPYGSRGVALGFSLAMLTLILPVIVWSKYGTLISMRDMAKTAMPPFVAAILGGLAGFWANSLMANYPSAFVRLLVSTVGLFIVYGIVLIFGFRQKDAFLSLLRSSGILSKRA